MINEHSKMSKLKLVVQFPDCPGICKSEQASYYAILLLSQAFLLTSHADHVACTDLVLLPHPCQGAIAF